MRGVVGHSSVPLRGRIVHRHFLGSFHWYLDCNSPKGLGPFVDLLLGLRRVCGLRPQIGRRAVQAFVCKLAVVDPKPQDSNSLDLKPQDRRLGSATLFPRNSACRFRAMHGCVLGGALRGECFGGFCEVFCQRKQHSRSANIRARSGPCRAQSDALKWSGNTILARLGCYVCEAIQVRKTSLNNC